VRGYRPSRGRSCSDLSSEHFTSPSGPSRALSQHSKQRYTLHQSVALQRLDIRRTRPIEHSSTMASRCPVFGTRPASPNSLPRQRRAKRSMDSAWPSCGVSRSLRVTAPDKRCCGSRPKSCLEAVHETGRTDDSVAEGHTLCRYWIRRNPRRHVTTTRKHDTQVAPSLSNRPAAAVRVLLGDGGDDGQQIRAPARENDIRGLALVRTAHHLDRPPQPSVWPPSRSLTDMPNAGTMAPDCELETWVLIPSNAIVRVAPPSRSNAAFGGGTSCSSAYTTTG